VVPIDPGPDELAFLERIASEFSVAVEAFLAKQQAVRQRNRLRTLFDITNALVSKLALTNYDWPGKIRELQNVLERSVILTSGTALQVAIPELFAKSPPVSLP
jgi:DNA-binding NtrC family response regulator